MRVKNTIANSELKRHFCFVLEQLRIKFQELQEYIRQNKNLFNADRIFASFGDSKYINRPLIYKDGFTFCVFPNMLLNVSIDYLYYTVTEKTSLGPIFEDYVNEQLEYYIQNKKFDFVREISYYDKSPKKTSDFILWDRDQLVFLDCKMKRITENGKHDLNVDTDFIEEVLKSDWYTNKKWEKYVTKNVSIPPFTKDFIEMGKDLGKIFRSYDDLCEDKYKVVDGITEKRFKAVILTFSPWVILDYITLAKIAEWYRNKGKKDKKSVHFTDIAIISATDFDECISIISEDFSIFVSNLEHNHNNKECVRKENSYLNNKVKEFHEELYKQMKFCL